MEKVDLGEAIENELRRQVERLNEPATRIFWEMLTYHMGWTGEEAGPEAQGKRLRPTLLLLAAAACTTRQPKDSWRPYLPAAASIELVHNFSLIHDDIQDSSELRRGRQSVWKKWGIPMAINAGDALFVLSVQAMLDLRGVCYEAMLITAMDILHRACLDLTRGQYLDMSYEKRSEVTITDYWDMISGKTAALFTSCFSIGSLLGGADLTKQQAYRDSGHYLGLAFQVKDDILGIWGDTEVTGKSVESDLVSGKKSLPVLLGLEQNSEFSMRWKRGGILPHEASDLANQLIREGVQNRSYEILDQLTEQAQRALRIADPLGPAGEELFQFPRRLSSRSY